MRTVSHSVKVIMAYKEIVDKKLDKKYITELIRSLPMDDALFMAMLSDQGLLPGNMKSQINAQATQVDKASYFIEHMIKPYLGINDTGCLEDLLAVMKKSGYRPVQHLARKITSELELESNSEGSSYTRTGMS